MEMEELTLRRLIDEGALGRVLRFESRLERRSAMQTLHPLKPHIDAERHYPALQTAILLVVG